MQSDVSPRIITSGIVSVKDRGFAYGDGVFETIRVLDNAKPRLWEYHKQRLLEGCCRLQISLAEQHVEQCWLAHQPASSYPYILKIVVTRGEGGRGYRPDKTLVPNIYLQTLPMPRLSCEQYDGGVDVQVCRHRLSKNPLLAGLKHLNRLDQVMGSSELADDHFEGLMCNQSGSLIEGTKTNIFLIQGKCIKTPPIDEEGVNGVLRRYLLDVAETMGYQVEVRPLRVEDCLAKCDINSGDGGLFLGNSVIGLMPVRMLGDQRLLLPSTALLLAQDINKRLNI